MIVQKEDYKGMPRRKQNKSVKRHAAPWSLAPAEECLE